MKNKSFALTLGILLISSALLVTIPKNVIAQQQEDEVDYTLTEQDIQAKITEFKTKHPKFAAVVEEIPNPGFTITAIDRDMAMIPTIICKILMPFETPVSDSVFIRYELQCKGVLKNISI